MSQKRDFFRVKFPVTQRPCLVASSSELEVIELSENGARVVAGHEGVLGNTDPFDATIRFKDGTAAKVTAQLYRCEADQAILRFSENLSYTVIAAEQRRLLQLFPRQVADCSGD